jgi:hypothetical protein
VRERVFFFTLLQELLHRITASTSLFIDGAPCARHDASTLAMISGRNHSQHSLSLIYRYLIVESDTNAGIGLIEHSETQYYAVTVRQSVSYPGDVPFLNQRIGFIREMQSCTNRGSET